MSRPWRSSQRGGDGSSLLADTACDCGDPTCTQGSDHCYSVSVVLDQVETTGSGAQLTRGTVIWTADRPARFRKPLQVDLPVPPLTGRTSGAPS